MDEIFDEYIALLIEYYREKKRTKQSFFPTHVSFTTFSKMPQFPRLNKFLDIVILKSF